MAKKKGYRAKKELDKLKKKTNKESRNIKKVDLDKSEQIDENRVNLAKEKIDIDLKRQNLAKWRKNKSEENPLFRSYEYDKAKYKYQQNPILRAQKVQSSTKSRKNKLEKNPQYKNEENKKARERYKQNPKFNAKKRDTNLNYIRRKRVTEPNFVLKQNEISAQLMKVSRARKKEEENKIKVSKKLKKEEEKRQKLNDQYDYRTSFFDALNELVECKRNAAVSKEEYAKLKFFRDFIVDLREVPHIICCSCEGLFFRNNPVPFNLETYFKKYNSKASKVNKNPNSNIEKDEKANQTEPKSRKSKFLSYVIEDVNEFKKEVVGTDSGMICYTCSRNLQNGKLPLMGPNCGVRRPEYYNRPEVVTKLTDLEALLVTPLIPFMQIMSRTPFQINSQLWIKGPVVNIQPDMSQILTLLPHKFTDSSVVQLDFKRNLSHASSYMHDVIETSKVFGALHYLLQQELYIKYNIKINKEAFKNYDPSSTAEQINFIIPNKGEVVNYIPKERDENSDKNEIEKNEDISQCKVNEVKIETKNKNKYMIFSNSITVKNENNEFFEYRFLSTFNCILNGIIGICKLDEIFLAFIKSQSSEYFQFIAQVLENPLENPNSKYIQLIVKNFPSALPNFQSSFKYKIYKDMYCNLHQAFDPFFKDHSSLTMFSVCEHCLNGKSQFWKIPCFNIINTNKNFNEVLQQDLINIAESSNPLAEGDKNYCLDCSTQIVKGDLIFQFEDLLLINVMNSNESEGKKSLHSYLYTHVPNILILNKSIYELKFVVHRAKKHFITFLKHEENFIELNDELYKETTVLDKKFKINPAFFCYFKVSLKKQDIQLDINATNLNDCLEINHDTNEPPQKMEILETKETKLKINSETVLHHTIPTSASPLEIDLEVETKNVTNYFNDMEGNPPQMDEIDSDYDLGDFQICNSSLESIHNQVDTFVLPEELENQIKQMEQIQEEEMEAEYENPQKVDHVLLMKNINEPAIQEFVESYDVNNPTIQFNETLVIAPGQSKRPIPSSQIEDRDALCFPRQYVGLRQLHDRKRISYTRACRNEINHYDRSRFDPQSILFKCKEKIKCDLASSVSIALRKCQAGALTKKDVTKPENIHRLVSKDVAYRILPQIRVSNEYVQKKEPRARRMLRQFGIPNIFFTFGMAETHSPELLQQAYKNVIHEDISKLDALNLTLEMKNFLIKKDPVLCAEIFNHRSLALESFMKSSNGLFGSKNVTHFMKRTETQMRGSIHEHDILWLRDAPVLIPYASEGKTENEDAICKFLDEHISTKFQKDHPNMSFQIHNHTHTCYKNTDNDDEKKCRFHFPRFVSLSTMIIYPQSKLNRTKDKLDDLEKIKRKMHYYKDTRISQTFEEMLKDLDMTIAQYYEAVRCDFFKISVLHKRDSDAVMVNNYNPTLLDTLEANHDVQFITDAYAAIHYLFKYCLKIDEGVNHLMKKAMEECRSGNKTIQETYKRIASIFYNTCYISAQQAVQEIKGFPIVKFSEDEKFINTNPPAKRTYLRKPLAELDLLDDSSTDVYERGFIHEYCVRPKYLENVPIVDFAALYTKTEKSKKKHPDDDEASSGDDDGNNQNNNEDQTEIVTKNRAKILYRKRGRPRLIRFVNYNLEYDEENYYREMCMLYRPFRDEEKELLNFAQVKETFTQYKDEIMAKYAEYTIISEDVLEELKQHVLENLHTEKNDEIKQFISDELSDVDDEDVFDALGIEEKIRKDKEPKKKSSRKLPDKGTKDKIYAMRKPQKIDRKELHSRIRAANVKQQEFILHINHIIRTIDLRTYDGPFTKIILQGSAGVGKTFILNIIIDMINDFFNNSPGADFETNKVLVVAPTGIAAYLIRGSTIHSAFQIDTRFNGQKKLGADILNTVRRELFDVKVIIADEYSMISSSIRIKMDKRSREIFGVQDQSYGGRIMIFAGDLFQLPPVKAKPIYPMSNPYAYDRGFNESDYALEQDWFEFRMFELDEVVRQSDTKYKIATANLGIGKLTEEDKEYLKLRVVQSEDDVPDDAIWLYYTNAQVDAFNKMKIEKMPGILYEAVAQDTIKIPETSAKNNSKMSSTDIKNAQLQIAKEYSNDVSENTRMKYIIQLKIGIRYKIATNLKVSDGLAKSVMGKLVHVSVDNNDRPILVWLKFNDPRIGAATKQPFIEFMKANKIPLDAVPIRLYSENITDRNNISIKLVHEAIRKQFPITPCESSTYHGIQGLGVPQTCMDFRSGKSISTALGYVGATRSDYNGIYFLGNIPNFKPRADHLTNEIFRLRNSASLELIYYNFNQTSGTKLIYHNVNSYKAHGEDVTAINWYWKADIIILSEANIQSSDEVKVRNGFKVLYPDAVISNKLKQKRSLGLIIICKNTCNIRNLSTPNIISNYSNTYHIDLRSFEIDNHLIITGYRHPKAPIEEFLNEVKRLVSNKPDGYDVTIMGDMNFDLKNLKVQTQNSFAKFLTQNSFINYLGECKTNMASSQIDIVFSTSSKGFGGTMASYFSDHFAIYFQTEINKSDLAKHHQEQLEFALSKHEQVSQKIKHIKRTKKEIKTGQLRNVPFKNKISCSILVQQENSKEIQEMEFSNMDSYNSVFSAFHALNNYSEFFEEVVEGLSLHYPFFEFILEVHDKYYTINKDQGWIDFLTDKYPNIVEFSDSEKKLKTKDMSCEVSVALRNLLTNWRFNSREIENEWASWERRMYICKTLDCQNVLESKQEMMIDLEISSHDLIENLNTVIEAHINGEALICSKCQNNIPVSPLISFSEFAVIINLKLTEVYPEINIAEIPKIIILNNTSFSLKIVIDNIDNHYKSFYRAEDNDFLEMNDKYGVGLEFFLKNCKEKVCPKILIYVKNESDISNENSEIEIDDKILQKDDDIINYVNNFTTNVKNESCTRETDEIQLNESEDISNILSTLRIKNSISFSEEITKSTASSIIVPINNGVHGNVPFPNEITLKYKNIYLKFTRMSAFNSIYSAFHSLFNYTKFFKGIMNELKSELPFFGFMLESNRNFNCKNYQRNVKWLSLIQKIFPSRINVKRRSLNITEIDISETNEMQQKEEINEKVIVCDMVWSILEVLGANLFNTENDGFLNNQDISLCKKYFCTKTKDEKRCSSSNCNGTSQEEEFFMLVKTLSKESLKNLTQAIIEKDLIAFECQKCKKKIKTKPEFSYPGCIIMTINLQSKNEHDRIDINEISKKIILNNKSYELKVIIDCTGFEFTSFYRFANDDFLEMNDVKYPMEFVHKYPQKKTIDVYPELLIYIKSDENLNNQNQVKDEKQRNARVFYNSPSINLNPLRIKNYHSSREYKSSTVIFKDCRDVLPTTRVEIKEPNNKKGVFGNVPFPNTIILKNKMVNKDTYLEFSSMCTFNSVYSAFSALFNYCELFKEIVTELTVDFPFFKFIVEVNKNFHNKNFQRNVQWLTLIQKTFPTKIVFESKVNYINILKTNEVGDLEKMQGMRNLIRFNMEDDVLNILDADNGSFFKNWENSVGKKYFSIKNKSAKCVDTSCNGISIEQELFVIMKSFSKESLKNLTQEIIEEHLLALNCSNCSKNIKTKPEFIYPDCIIIRTDLQRELLYTSEEININEISKKIILNNESYVLKIIIDHPMGHFRTFYRMEEGNLLEMNDTKFPEETIHSYPQNNSIKVNPVLLIYIKGDEKKIDQIRPLEKEKEKWDAMDFYDPETVDLEYSEESENEPMEIDESPKSSPKQKCNISLNNKKYLQSPGTPKQREKKYKHEESNKVSIVQNAYHENKKCALHPNSVTLLSTYETFNFLCPYNSTLNGFAKSFCLDLSFRRFILDNQNKFGYFRILIKLLNSDNQNDRNEIWIKFLHQMLDDANINRTSLAKYPFKPTNQKTYSMIWNAEDAIIYTLPNFMSFLTKFKCNQCNQEDGNDRKRCIIHLKCRVGDQPLSVQLKKFNDAIPKSYQTRSCKNCNIDFTSIYTYNDIILIKPLLSFNDIPSIPLIEIPKAIDVNNERYRLKFIVHYENFNDENTVNHYQCYTYDNENNKYFFIDDLGQKEKCIGESNIKINPDILCYFKQ